MEASDTTHEVVSSGLCDECKLFETWIQDYVIGRSSPVPFGSHKIQLGTVSEIVKSKDCRLCCFISEALKASFDPPLPLQYTTYTGTWDDQITLAADSLLAKPNEYEVGFKILLSSLSAIGVEPFGGTALNEENLTHEGYKFYPTVRLIAQDASRVPAGTKPAIRLGKLISPTQCNIQEICQIYSACVNTHGGECESPRNAASDKDASSSRQILPVPRGFRVVDVKKKCIVKVKKPCRYIALSYVWGKTPFLQTRLANVGQLETPGFLGGRDAIVPRTLWESIALTEMLGERYLWIDALCIVQDDHISKMDQISRMDQIYLHACLTIVAGDGADADAGLSGFSPGSRLFHQNVVSLAGLQFVSLTAPILKTFNDLKWHSRAWTYQEFMLSKRLLVFTKQQVYYNCNQQHYSEDSVILNKTDPPWWDSRLQVNHGRMIWNSDRWFSYMHLVREITRRDMTMPTDIVRSVTGVFSSMNMYTGEEFVCGLPSSLLETSLMWQPLGPLRKRGMAYSGYPFPTWSWIGWDGKVCYSEDYLPYSVYPVVTSWKLYTPNNQSRSQRQSDTSFHEWTLTEVMRDCTPVTPRTIKVVAKNSGDYSQTIWTTTSQLASASGQPKISRKAVFKAIVKRLVSSDEDAYPNLLGQSGIGISSESSVLHFNGQTKCLFIDPTPTPYFHKDLHTPQTGVFRILNHAQQWMGTIHLALPPPFGSATAPVSAEFVAIAASIISFEDTNSINPGPNFGQNTFDTGLWQQLLPAAREVRLLNVLWIHWVGDVAQRLGAGQVHKDAWAVGEVVNKEIWLA